MTSDSGVGVVVVSHGQLATELLNAAEMIVGDLPRFTAVSIGWHDDVDVARAEIGRAIEKVQTARGVLILTDMFGGTPSNLGLTFLEEGRVELMTGANLPMLLRLARVGASKDLSSLARDMCDHGRAAIQVASELLRKDAGGG